jgi:hypothetical protein
VSRHFDDLDAVLEFDALDDFDFGGGHTIYIGGIVLRGPMLGRNGTNEHHAPSPTSRGHLQNKVLFRRKINLFNHGFSTYSLGFDRILRW